HLDASTAVEHADRGARTAHVAIRRGHDNVVARLLQVGGEDVNAFGFDAVVVRHQDAHRLQCGTRREERPDRVAENSHPVVSAFSSSNRQIVSGSEFATSEGSACQIAGSASTYSSMRFPSGSVT